MSLHASTWPSDLYHSEGPGTIASAEEFGGTGARSLHSEVAENAAGILFTAFFAAEVALVVAGIGFILASVAALSW